MPIEDVDVDTILTDQELDDFLGGAVSTGPMDLAPEAWQNKAKVARQFALDRILEYLRGRVPTIAYSDLAYPEEMKPGVKYGAAEHLYQLAMSTSQGGDVYAKQRELYAEKFQDWLAGFQPTTDAGLVITGGFTVGRA